jgi:hypothetical protein
MGQAKNRGPREERVRQAQELQAKEEPINVPCKTCKTPLNGFTLLSNSVAGAAWQKKCECGALTTAVVQAKDSTVDRAFRTTLGLTKEIAGKDKKVSVSFLEKTVDTIETGLIRLPAMS